MGKRLTMEEATKRAVALAGGNRAVAKHFDLTTTSVWKWKKVPIERAEGLAALTGGKITHYQLRPDIFKKKRRGHST